MKYIIFSCIALFSTIGLLAQNVGIHTNNPTENLHIRTDSSKVAIRYDNTKSVDSGVNYFTAIGTPTSVQNIEVHPDYIDWTDLNASKMISSDNNTLNSPTLDIWPEVANILRIYFDFDNTIPSTANITNVTFNAEWKRNGNAAGELRISQIYLRQAINNLPLLSFGFLTKITSSTDVNVALNYDLIFDPVTPDMLNLNDVYISLQYLHSVSQGTSRLEIDKLWLEVEYNVPANGSENVSWTTGVKDGVFKITNSDNLESNQFLAIDEVGVTQLKGLRITKNAGANKFLTSNEDGRASWVDLPLQSEVLWLNKNDTAAYASGPVQINNKITESALIFDKGANRLNNGINFAETDNRIFNILIDANNDQVNEQLNIYRDSTQVLAQDPAFRFNLGGQDSWLNGGGNVGIGTVNPTQELSVIGTIRSSFDSLESEFVEIKHGGNNGIINTVGDGRLLFQHDGNNMMSILDDGKVGIGVFNPLEQLQVSGAITIGNTTSIAPSEGTLRWNGANTRFEGHDGTQWVALSRLEDADGDTKIIVENTPDEDIIRFSSAGITSWSIKNHQLRSHNQNIAIGTSSLNSLTTGINNVALGTSSLKNLTSGEGNVALGTGSLSSIISKTGLVAVGDSSLHMNGTGNPTSSQAVKNTAVGNKSLKQNSLGAGNTALGFEALKSNTTGDNNIAIGTPTLPDNTTGSENVGVGSFTLYKNISGSGNTAVGNGAMQDRVDGGSNTAIGQNAMIFLETGNFNTAVGRSANSSSGTRTNSTGIGYNAQPAGSNDIRLGNSSISTIGGFAAWSNISDGRVKKDVQENIVGLDFINKLRPVTYHLDMDAIAAILGTTDDLRLYDAEIAKEAEIQNGFIAQEVEQAAKDVNFDFHGVEKPLHEHDHYSLRYSEFVVPLVKSVQELSASNEALKEEIEALKSQNAEMMAQIKLLLEK